MALARIITRSHQYAQQLALDLLARGYAVEIVSPEAIPANPADLELRVEAAGTELQGQVTDIREQGKSRSIEYLQRLKPMMADLLRKWPANEAKQVGSEKSAEFNLNAESQYSDDVELPLNQNQRQSEPAQMPSPKPEFAESARHISPPSSQKPSSVANSIFSITGEPISWDESEPERSGSSEVWFWRAAVGFACMALLILVLGMALRKNPSAPAQAAAPVATQTMAATTQMQAAPKPSAASVEPLPVKAAVLPTVAPISMDAKAKPPAALRRAKVGRNDDQVKGDTTVTYFNSKAAEPPKATTNQASGIKHYSDMD